MSRVKITRCLLSSSCWVPPSPPLGPLWPALFLCLGQAGRKTFGSAPCLSRVQHYQGSRLVSSISRCLSLLRSQVSSQDFLALGKIECLSESSRPVFHLQPPGSDWVTALALPVSPSPSAWPAEEALCVVVLALWRKEPPSFHPSPDVLGLLQPRHRLRSGTAFQERAIPACLQRQECQPQRTQPLTVSKSKWDLFSTWLFPARNFQLF